MSSTHFHTPPPMQPTQSPLPSRRERSALAAQACETCRTRKSKCDEKRPRCGFCERLDLPCKYRGPQPTKKDKSLNEIIDIVKRLESKMDNLTGTLDPTLKQISSASSFNMFDAESSSSGTRHSAARSPAGPHSQSSPSDPRFVKDSELLTPQKVLLWPAVHELLGSVSSDMQSRVSVLKEHGMNFFARRQLEKHPKPLETSFSHPNPQVASNSDIAGIAPLPTLASLTLKDAHRAVDMYFGTFNIIFPIVDDRLSLTASMENAFATRFEDTGPETIKILLVIALGVVAQEGILGRPISDKNIMKHYISGIRGGSAEDPPGKEIFHQALVRLGPFMQHTFLDNIQCQLLICLYYEACGRYLEYWRSVVSAGMGLQIQLKCFDGAWGTREGAMMRTLFWNCYLMESWYHMDLDLPLAGVTAWEDEVPLPVDNDNNHIVMTYFSAIVALCQITSRIHDAVFGASRTESAESYAGLPAKVIDELVRQIHSWRRLLPVDLQWKDEDRATLAVTPATVAQYSDPPVSAAFTGNLTSLPLETAHPSAAYDNESTAPAAPTVEFPQHHSSAPGIHILIAQLRSRYYCAMFLSYRPFVYKALHFPRHLTAEERACAGRCLQSMLLWPISLAPCKDQKRLIPSLFAWTQHFFGILILLRLIWTNPTLQDIASEYLDFEQVKATVELLMEWMADVKQIDGLADWAWPVLESLWQNFPPES